MVACVQLFSISAKNENFKMYRNVDIKGSKRNKSAHRRKEKERVKWKNKTNECLSTGIDGHAMRLLFLLRYFININFEFIFVSIFCVSHCMRYFPVVCVFRIFYFFFNFLWDQKWRGWKAKSIATECSIEYKRKICP